MVERRLEKLLDDFIFSPSHVRKWISGANGKQERTVFGDWSDEYCVRV